MSRLRRYPDFYISNLCTWLIVSQADVVMEKFGPRHKIYPLSRHREWEIFSYSNWPHNLEFLWSKVRIALLLIAFPCGYIRVLMRGKKPISLGSWTDRQLSSGQKRQRFRDRSHLVVNNFKPSSKPLSNLPPQVNWLTLGLQTRFGPSLSFSITAFSMIPLTYLLLQSFASPIWI